MHSLQHVLGQKLKREKTKKNTDLRMNFGDYVKAKTACRRCQPCRLMHSSCIRSVSNTSWGPGSVRGTWGERPTTWNLTDTRGKN